MPPTHAQSALAHLSLAHDHARLSTVEELTAIAAGMTVGAAATAFISAVHGTTSSASPEATQQLLLDIKERIMAIDSNLDQLASDWSQLKPAITSRLTSDADTIAKLSAELLDAAKSTTPISDDRAAALHADMQGVIASLTGTAEAVGKVPDPTTPSSAAPSGSAPAAPTPSGTTATPAASGTTTSVAPSTSGSGTAPAANPAAPPPGSL